MVRQCTGALDVRDWRLSRSWTTRCRLPGPNAAKGQTHALLIGSLALECWGAPGVQGFSLFDVVTVEETAADYLKHGDETPLSRDSSKRLRIDHEVACLIVMV
jgi:hypothetical protein